MYLVHGRGRREGKYNNAAGGSAMAVLYSNKRQVRYQEQVLPVLMIDSRAAWRSEDDVSAGSPVWSAIR